MYMSAFLRNPQRQQLLLFVLLYRLWTNFLIWFYFANYFDCFISCAFKDSGIWAGSRYPIQLMAIDRVCIADPHEIFSHQYSILDTLSGDRQGWVGDKNTHSTFNAFEIYGYISIGMFSKKGHCTILWLMHWHNYCLQCATLGQLHLTHWGREQITAILHFQMHFHEWELLYLDYNFLEIC